MGPAWIKAAGLGRAAQNGEATMTRPDPHTSGNHRTAGTPEVPERLDITRATLDDWSVISGWAAEEGWNPGLADARSFFAQDPDGFFIGRVDGEPVSAISVVNYGDDYAFLGFYLVRPDLRGRGYGIATWKAALTHAGGRTVGLDGVPAQQDNYRKSGFEPPTRPSATRASRRPRARPKAIGHPAPSSPSPRRAASSPSPCTTAPATPRTGPASSPPGSPVTGIARSPASSTAVSPATASSARPSTRSASARCSPTPRRTPVRCSTLSSRRSAGPWSPWTSPSRTRPRWHSPRRTA